MTDNVVVAFKKNELPDDFWSLPEFEGWAGHQDIHTLLAQRLQEESPDADTLEIMMMERVCFLYIFMRAKENSAELEFDRNYKDMMQLWISMAADLRKVRLRAEETSSIRMMIVGEVSKALKEAMKDVDPAISNAVQTKLVTLVAV